MIKKQGFTLVEMLGVLIILIIVFMIMFPSLTKIIKTTNVEIDEATSAVIESATADYLSEKSDIYPKSEDNTYCITLVQLIDNANLTEKQIASLEDKEMIVKTTFIDNKPVYEITKTCDAVSVAIEFTLVGNSNLSFEVGVGGQYVEPGALAKNKAGDIESYTVTITDSSKATVAYVDTTIIDTYAVKYTATIDGKNYSIERTVKVVDTTDPVIVVNPTSTTLSITNNTYNVLDGVTSSDNSGEIPKVKASTSLSLGQPGTYAVTYTAEDSSGNIKTASRTVIVSSNKLVNVTLIGTAILNSTVSYNYTDAGATATDSDGTNITAELTQTIKKNGVVVANVNTNGTYYVTYSILKENIIYSETRMVNVLVTNCAYDTVGSNWTFAYTGDSQTFTTPCLATYKIELWGASGGGTSDATKGVSLGGRGGYVAGNIALTPATNLYVYVGETGGIFTSANVATTTLYTAKWNGGGAGALDSSEAAASGEHGFPGGGSTDIRLTSGVYNDVTSMRSKIMVAAGGGGGGWSGNGSTDQYYAGGGGSGGGLSGLLPTGATTYTLGTQISGSAFGIGGNGIFGTGGNNNGTGGGGGGYYGGGQGTSFVKPNSSGSGGSSFVSGFTGCNAINASGVATGQANHYSGYVLTSGQMINGNTSMPTTTTGTEIGHTGNGYAKITILSFG